MVVFHTMEIFGFRIKVILLLLLVSGPFWGCSDRDNPDGLPLIVIQPNRITEEVSNLSSYVSELEVFPLVNDTTAFKGVTKLLISNNYFILSGGVVFAESFAGSELRKIGNIGRGPGEYLSIKDIAISPDGKELWCLELYNSILRYDAEDGHFLGKVDITKEIGYVKGIIPISPTELALYIPNPTTTGYCLSFYNTNGKETGNAMPYSQYNFDMGFSLPVAVSDDDIYAISPESKMPSIIYHNGIPEKQYVFDFGNKTPPDKYYSLNQDDPWGGFGELFEMDYYKHISSLFFPKDDICFRAFGKDSSSWNYYINKEKTRGIRWESVGVMTPPICPIAAEDGYVYFPYDDYGYLSLKDEKDILKKLVIEKFGLPERPKATFLIKVKFSVQ